jgi:hypothetical protein
MVMNIEEAVRNVFEREIGRIEAGVPPPVENTNLPADKGRKERRGSLVLCLVMASALSVFSLKTGLLRNPLVVEWESLGAVIPENFMGELLKNFAFQGF